MNFKNEIEEYHSEKIGGMWIVTFLLTTFILLIGGCFVAVFGQTGGYKHPHKTQVELDAITPTTGEIFFNTTTGTHVQWDGAVFSPWGGEFTSNIDTVATVARIATYTGTAKAIIVTDSLEGGLFVLSPKVVGVNNALFYKDGNTRQFARVYDGPLNLQWFGAKPDNTGDLTTAINAAIAASKRTQSGAFKATQTMYLPSGNYRKETQLTIDEAIHIVGDIGSNNSNTVINDVNGTGFYFQHSNQVGVTTVSDAARFENIKIIGNGTGTGFDVHAQINMDNVRLNNYEKGIYINADGSTNTGNANHSNFDQVVVDGCEFGVLLKGDDGNTAVFQHCQVNNSVWGFVDSSLLNNVFSYCHTANDSVAFWSKLATSGSSFIECYAEGAASGSRPQLCEINAPSRIRMGTIGSSSQLTGTGYKEVSGSLGMVAYNSIYAYQNDLFDMQLGNYAGGNRPLKVRGLTDTDPGFILQYNNGSYVYSHRGIDARRVFQIAGDATTLTNQHGTARTGGSIVFPWGIWTGGGTLTGNNAARILGNTDTTGIVSPVNGDFMFNSNPTGLGGVPFYYRKGGKWVNPFAIATLQDADADTKIQVEESPDEDIIRFDAGGNEVSVMSNDSLLFKRRVVFEGTTGGSTQNTTPGLFLRNTTYGGGHFRVLMNTAGAGQLVNSVGGNSLIFQANGQILGTVADNLSEAFKLQASGESTPFMVYNSNNALESLTFNVGAIPSYLRSNIAGWQGAVRSTLDTDYVSRFGASTTEAYLESRDTANDVTASQVFSKEDGAGIVWQEGEADEALLRIGNDGSGNSSFIAKTDSTLNGSVRLGAALTVTTNPSSGQVKMDFVTDGTFIVTESSASTSTITIGGLNLLNTTSNAITATVPAGAQPNDIFQVIDSRGNAGTNNITINFTTNGYNHFGTSQNAIINGNFGVLKFRYINSTIGWVFI